MIIVKAECSLFNKHKESINREELAIYLTGFFYHYFNIHWLADTV